MTNILADYFRSSEDFASCFDSGEASGRAGYFRFAGNTLYGRSRVPTAVDPDSPLEDLAAHVAVNGSTVSLPFDAREVVENLLLERYAADYRIDQSGSGLRGLVRKTYYLVRPALPVVVRKHIQRRSLKGRGQSPFPAWPVDRTVDNFLRNLMSLGMQARGMEQAPFIWFWPDGHSGCIVMTHDVETSAGLDFCPSLMDLNDSYGIQSSFQIIPEGRYKASSHLLEQISARGFEVNVHDWNHDGFLFSDRKLFLARVAKINQAADAYGAEGFRSGVLYRNPDWYDAFAFSYDMSVPNVGRMDPQLGGCCTVMPYFIGLILEIPVTTSQDYSLFHILRDYSIDLWKRQLELILESHGLASFIVHPDYIIEKRARQTYVQLLEHLSALRAQRNVWVARPKDVNRWWRERRQMRLVWKGERWQIEGAGSERARLAYAVLAQNLTYTLDSQASATTHH